jgi:SOS response regulatory protein OraA/RecX
MPSSFADFVMGSSQPDDRNRLEKLAEAKVEQELVFRKVADHARGEGAFAGKGFLHGLIKRALNESSGAEVSGINNANAPTVAQTPPRGGIELPSDAPGPNEKLRTVRPGGGEQYNNELLTKKIEEKRLQAGLANAQNEGLSTLSGAEHGTSAQFAIDHE